MTNRINHLIEELGINKAQFAQQIEVSPASVTHVLNGRNNPSLELVTKILTTFPSISSDWLLLGEGSMYKSRDHHASNDTAATVITPTEATATEDSSRMITRIEIKEVPKPVDHITIFYDDQTYCNFYPK